MMQVALQPDEPCKVVLPAQQWQSIIAVLHDAPYRVAKPLIEAIIGQCQQQAQAQQMGTHDEALVTQFRPAS